MKNIKQLLWSWAAFKVGFISFFFFIVIFFVYNTIAERNSVILRPAVKLPCQGNLYTYKLDNYRQYDQIVTIRPGDYGKFTNMGIKAVVIIGEDPDNILYKAFVDTGTIWA